MIPTLFHLRVVYELLRWCSAVAIGAFAGSLIFVLLGFPGTATLPADCAVVFGAAVHGNNDPGPGIFRRVETAARLYREGEVRTVFLTGGRGYGDTDTEAEVMRRVALRSGIDPESIVLEEESTSTTENILNTLPLAGGCSSTVGLSDRYHLARIHYLARISNWEHFEVFPADRHAGLLFESASVFREALANLYYLVKYTVPYGEVLLRR